MGLKPSNAVSNWNNIRLKIEQEKTQWVFVQQVKNTETKERKKKKKQYRLKPYLNMGNGKLFSFLGFELSVMFVFVFVFCGVLGLLLIVLPGGVLGKQEFLKRVKT